MYLRDAGLGKQARRDHEGDHRPAEVDRDLRYDRDRVDDEQGDPYPAVGPAVPGQRISRSGDQVVETAHAQAEQQVAKGDGRGAEVPVQLGAEPDDLVVDAGPAV